MKKVISFSLWGDLPKYYVGAERNIRMYNQLLSDWEPWVYCDYENFDRLSFIHKKRPFDKVRIIKRSTRGDWTGMFWRFEPVKHDDVEMFASRDTDCRPCEREIVAMNGWSNSNSIFHIMRDHPWHNRPILGGLFAAKRQCFSEFNLPRSFDKSDNYWQVDQDFLAKIVYPKVKDFAMENDDFFSKKAWPCARTGLRFCGESFDEYDIPEISASLALSCYLKGMR
jgi:hypothetical protein